MNRILTSLLIGVVSLFSINVMSATSDIVDDEINTTALYVGFGGKTTKPCGDSHDNRCANTSLLPNNKGVGQDVYFLAGTNNGVRDFVVDWSGTESDRVVISCYYIDNNSVTFCNSGSGADKQILPIMRGGYNDTRIQQCKDRSANCVPSYDTSKTKYILKLAKNSKFVTVQDLYFMDSYGSGIYIEGDNSINNISNHIIERNRIEDTVGSAILVDNSTSRSMNIFRFNTIDKTSRLNVDNISQREILGCIEVNYSIGFTSSATNSLIENNTITNCGGYSIKLNKTDYNIIRENILANSRGTKVYINNSSYNVIEHNILLGGDYESETSLNQSDSFNIFTTSQSNFSIENIIRNNMVLSNGDLGIDVLNSVDSRVGAYILGNTFNSTSKTFRSGSVSNPYIIRSTSLTDRNLQSLIIKNNAYIGYPNTNCSIPSSLTEKIILNNAFSALPSDSDCRGTNYETTSLGLTSITTEATYTNFPDVINGEFTKPLLNSNLYSQGVQSIEKILSVSNYPQYRFASGNICKPSVDNWEKELVVDYACNIRESVPTIGALEYRGVDKLGLDTNIPENLSNPDVVNLQQSNALFVDSVNGNDSNTCDSPYAACRTLSGAFSKPHINGQDVFLRAETIINDGETTRTINWNGSNLDPVIFGCYYLSTSGEAISCDSGENAGEREWPIIQGNLTDACRSSNNCQFTNTAIQNKKINIKADYVIIKNVKFKGIIGKAVVVDSVDYANGRVGVKVIDNNFEFMGSSAIVFDSGIRDSIIKGNEISNTGWCQIQNKVNSTSCLSTSGTAIPFTSSILLTRNPNANTLIENNTIYNSYGEGIGIRYGTTHTIVKGNRIGNLHSNAFLIDGVDNVVVESNIVWGIPDNVNPYYTSSNTQYGKGNQLGITLKNDSLGYEYTAPPTNIVFRNNVLVGRGGCMSVALGPSASTSAEGYQMSAYVYGNTCVGFNQFGIFGALESDDVDTVEIKSNIYTSPDISSNNICKSGQSTMDFNYNVWSANPTDSDCDGTYDKTGEVLLKNTYANIISKNLYPNVPVIDDFVPKCDVTSGYTVITDYLGSNDGDPNLRDTTLLDSDNFTILSESDYPYVVNLTNWEKKMYYDFSGNTRDSYAFFETTKPNAGAVETCYSTLGGTILYTPTEEGAFFIGDGGSDNLDCLSHQTRCLTTDGIKNKSKSVGKDVYILAGSDNGVRTFDIDWSGSESDPVEVSCYYIYGTSSTAVCNGSQTQPILRGTVTDACITNKTCLYNNINAVPSSEYQGIVNITGSNVNVFDLDIRQSSAVGIRVAANNTYDNITISANSFSDNISSSIVFDKVKPGGSYVATGNVMDNTSIKVALFGNTKGFAMPCIHVNATDSDNDFVYTQIKTNTISNCGGPAIAFIKTRGGLIQSNTISNFNKFGIYLDNSVGSVSEKNIIVGKGYNDGQLESEGAAFAVTSYEYGATGGGSTGHLIRNNLVSNVKTSLYSICTSADCSTGTYKIGYRLYGNTFAHLRSNIFNSDSTVNTNTMANIKIVNNVFQDADSCVLNNVTTLSKLDIKYNAFVDADLTTNYHCYGQNFATGTNEEDVGFSVNLVDAYTDSIPDPVDWKATIDGMLVDGGIAADDPIITDLLMPADDYPFFVDEYLNGLYYDYGNVSRSANGFTNYGAWESINN